MDLKWILLVAFVLVLVVNHQVEADFRSWPDADELEMKGLKCAPGRTIIKLEEKKAEPIIIDSGDEEDNYNGRRTHMNTNIKEEYCKVCVCSAEGKDEYCSGRPAANVNECIRMSKIMEEFNRNEPYEHTRVLSQRIRRVGGNDDEKEVSTCVPFVSEYTTCNAENQCRGCIRCLCILGGRWSCQEVRKCRDDGPEEIAYNAINTAMNEIQFSIENYNRNEATTSKTPFVPPPPEREPDLLLGYIIGVPK